MGRAQVMGIVNVTPDSFSDGGLYLEEEAAIAHGLELAAEGADILDIGGESTRPGAAAVDAAAEIDRVVPVIEALAGAGTAPVSVDTSKAEVAAAAIDAGAEIVNDVTAFADPDMAALCAERDVRVVLMHMQGTPRTMQENPTYDDVVEDVRAFLAARVEAAVAAGIAEERIWVDPGIGFGKTVEHNLELIRRLGEIAALAPVLLGVSRKSFLGKLTGREVDDRLGASIAAAVAGVQAGASAVRVHDVGQTRDALTLLDALGTTAGREARLA